MTVERKFVAIALVVLSVFLFLAPQEAEGRGFRRFGPIRAFFSRPVRGVAFSPRRQARRVRRFPSPQVRQGCGGFSCVPQKGAGYNGGHKFVNNHFDINDFKQVDPRFKTLAENKGQLFERVGGRVTGQLFVDPHSGQLFSVPIDRFGNVRGYKRPVNADSLVFNQLARFYFDNLDKFKSAVRDAVIDGDKKALFKAQKNLDLVNNFLNFSQRATGIARNGFVNFDMTKMKLPSKLEGKGYSAQEVALAGLNSTLNMLTNQCDILCAGPTIGKAGNIPGQCKQIGQVRGGVVQTNLTGAFSDRVIDFMTNAVEDPYACGDKSTVRVDHFIASTMGDPNKYYAIKQVPREYEELAIRQGISINSIKTAQSRELKMVVGDGESIVAKTEGPSRVTSFQNQDRVRAKFGGRPAVAAMSLDFQNNSGAGISLVTGTSQDLLHDPLGVIGSQAGGEKIDEQCNGFHMYSVQDGNGGRANGVPANIAGHKNIINGNEVSNPISCRDCHSNGFRSAQKDPKSDTLRHKTNPFEFLPAGEAARARDLGYRTPQEISGVTADLNRDYVRAQKMGNAWLSDKEKPGTSIPAEVEITRQYFTPLEDEDVARELGIPGMTVERLASLQGPDGARLTGLKFVKDPNKKDKNGKPVSRAISRDSFAQIYCKAKSILRGGAQFGAGASDVNGVRGTGSGSGIRFNHQTGQRN